MTCFMGAVMVTADPFGDDHCYIRNMRRDQIHVGDIVPVISVYVDRLPVASPKDVQLRNGCRDKFRGLQLF